MIDILIDKISQLPGIGNKSAKRIVLHLLNRRGLMRGLIASMESVIGSASYCYSCGNLDTQTPCRVCSDPDRDKSTICFVKCVSDLWAFEKADVYKGIYYVVGDDLLSSTDKINDIKEKITDNLTVLKEVILAMGATLEDQITTHYLQKILEKGDILITTLACGIPLGAEIDYIDEGTLAIAMQSRKQL